MEENSELVKSAGSGVLSSARAVIRGCGSGSGTEGGDNDASTTATTVTTPGDMEDADTFPVGTRLSAEANANASTPVDGASVPPNEIHPHSTSSSSFDQAKKLFESPERHRDPSATVHHRHASRELSPEALAHAAQSRSFFKRLESTKPQEPVILRTGRTLTFSCIDLAAYDEIRADIAAREAETTMLHKRVADLTARMRDQATASEELRTRLSTLQAEFVTLQDERDAALAAKNDMAARNAELEMRNKSHVEELRTSKHELAQTAAKLSIAEQAAQTSQIEVEDAHSRLEDLEASMVQLTAGLKAAKVALGAMTAERDAAALEAAMAQQNLKTLDTRLQETVQGHQILQSRLQDAEAELATTSKQLREVSANFKLKEQDRNDSATRSDLQDQLEASHRHIAALQDELKAATSKAQSLAIQSSIVSEEASTEKAAREEAERALAESTKEIEALKRMAVAGSRYGTAAATPLKPGKSANGPRRRRRTLERLHAPKGFGSPSRPSPGGSLQSYEIWPGHGEAQPTTCPKTTPRRASLAKTRPNSTSCAASTSSNSPQNDMPAKPKHTFLRRGSGNSSASTAVSPPAVSPYGQPRAPTKRRAARKSMPASSSSRLAAAQLLPSSPIDDRSRIAASRRKSMCSTKTRRSSASAESVENRPPFRFYASYSKAANSEATTSQEDNSPSKAASDSAAPKAAEAPTPPGHSNSSRVCL